MAANATAAVIAVAALSAFTGAVHDRGQAGAAAPSWQRAAPIKLPASADPTRLSGLTTVSCTPTGFCTAGGYYTDSAGRTWPMIATRSAGSWSQAAILPLPADAATEPLATVGGVSCTSPAACVAVGHYESTAGAYYQAFLTIKSSSGWARSFAPRLPADSSASHLGELDAVTCTGPGACVAIGSYQDTAGSDEGMAVREIGGKWGRAVTIPTPIRVTPVRLTGSSVSCPSAGNCVAVGWYAAGSVSSYWRAAESAGTWHGVRPARLPGDATTHQEGDGISVSCPAAGSCTVLGSYETVKGATPLFAQQESGGTWGSPYPVKAPLPADAGTPVTTSLGAVVCVPHAPCVASAGYATAASGFAAAALAQIAGKWQVRETALPAGSAVGSASLAILEGVSCWGDVHCVAVGSYTTSQGYARPMAVRTS